jgi:prepilin-type N-terminal cleavage/methylation domain-containing protein
MSTHPPSSTTRASRNTPLLVSGPLRPPSSALRPPPSALRPPPSALRPPPSALRPPSSALRPPPSVLRPPPSALRLPCPGFTLIELLVVVAVIAILAAMIIPITGAVGRTKIRTKARAELKQVESAIEGYKTKLGYYPPVDTNRMDFNPLYYELGGTRIDNNGNFTTLDGSSQINGGSVRALFGLNIGGFSNSTKGAGDEGPRAVNFLGRGFKPGQYLLTAQTVPHIIVLGSTLEGPLMYPGVSAATKINPWRYNSVTPTNNPDSFDLWIDVKVGGKTNRISNWSDKPIEL